MLALIAALLLSAAAPHWLALTLAQAVAGMAAGVILPAAYGSASLIAQPGQEARTLGRVIAGWSVSLVAGVPLSALISDAIGWRATYGVLALCAAVALLGLRRLPERRPPIPRRAPVAPVGAAVVPRRAGAAAGLPGILVRLYGVYAFLADHVRRLLALSAGQVVSSPRLAPASCCRACGRAADRTPPPAPLALGAAALVYLALLPAARALPAVLLIAAVWGAASQLCLNLLVLLLSRARPEERGAVLGLNTCVTYLGASLAPPSPARCTPMPASPRWPCRPAAPSRSPRWDCTGA